MKPLILIAFASAALFLLFPGLFMRVICHSRAQYIVGADWVRIQPRWLNRILGGPAATTFSATCITVDGAYWAALDDDERDTLISHELIHCQQARKWKALYLPVYLILLIRHGYSDHPWEVEANAKEHTHAGRH